MLFLTNDDVDQLLDIEAGISALADAYLELDRGDAALRPRATFHVPHGPDRRFTFATMDGISRGTGIAAVRIRSDFVVVDTEHSRETKYARAPGDYCGLVLLFDIENAEPLAILNDGRLQQLRVAATAAVAAAEMALPHSRSLTLVGSGGQAYAHALAYRAIRPIERILVFSPTEANRTSFAETLSAELGVSVEAVSEARAAVADADIVAACTSSIAPVLEAAWLRPGSHVSSVRPRSEIGADVIGQADRVVVHQRAGSPTYRVGARSARSAHDESGCTPVPDDAPDLVDLLVGRYVGRERDDERTCFLNNVGTGLQFAACAGLAYRRAIAQGRGHEVPTSWFLQQISD